MRTFYEQHGIGRAKYTVSFHNGTSTHKDGSPFFDIAIFRNKRKMERFKKDLAEQGYTQTN